MVHDFIDDDVAIRTTDRGGQREKDQCCDQSAKTGAGGLEHKNKMLRFGIERNLAGVEIRRGWSSQSAGASRIRKLELAKGAAAATKSILVPAEGSQGSQ